VDPSRAAAESPPTIGWREWLSLPELKVKRIKAKIDTGARSSSVHAFEIEPFTRDESDWVRFSIHPLQRNDKNIVIAEAPVLDQRSVRSSSGHVTLRYVISTTVLWNQQSWPIELTLADRDSMGFRMLLGREAFRRRFLVDSARSYVGGRLKRT
jgi:hypothetical protein